MTDVGSTKVQIVGAGGEAATTSPARRAFCRAIRWRARNRAARLLAEAKLFDGAMWLFTPVAGCSDAALEDGVARMGGEASVRARMDIDAGAA